MDLDEKNKKLLIEKLFKDWGAKSAQEFAEKYAFAADGVPGICIKCQEYTTPCHEPDQDKGYCEECETTTVVSGLVLLDLI